MVAKNRFGGDWTRVKLDVLEDYLRFYATALKKQSFTLHYADAFAGTGTYDHKTVENQESLIQTNGLKGSATIALGIDSCFDYYHLNDLNPEHVKELDKLKSQYLNKNIKVSGEDANEFIPSFCKSLKGRDRAVLFVDPYGTQLHWDTLKYIQDSKKIDLWLLFPFSTLLRLTPKYVDKINEEWRDTLNMFLGTNEWEKDLYELKQISREQDLFDNLDSNPKFERINVKKLELLMTKRLEDMFPFVADPLLLRSGNKPLFLFYFAVSNPRLKAQELARKVVRQIIDKKR